MFTPQSTQTEVIGGKHHPATNLLRRTPISTFQSDNILLQRKSNCACGGGCPGCQQDSYPESIQTKLQVSTPGKLSVTVPVVFEGPVVFAAVIV